MQVSSYCADVAGDVMLDTTAEAIRFQREWWKEQKLAADDLSPELKAPIIDGTKG